jgi:hypothetical protein
VRSTQKLPTVLADARECADERNQQRYGASGRREILGGQTHHLAEVAERAFAAVALPVGIADEAHRRIENKVGGEFGHICRIERERRLEAQDRIQQQESGRVEQQHGNRIGQPVLFARFVDTGDPIKTKLDRAEDG